MNRNQRRFGKVPRKNDSRLKVSRSRHGSEIEEVFPPKARRGFVRAERDNIMTNRCCYVSPEQKDFGQLAELRAPTEKYQDVLLEQYGFEPIKPETITQLKELKKVLCGDLSKVENCSQYANHDCKVAPAYVAMSDGSQWQNVDNTDDLDRFLMHREKATCMNYDRLPKNIHISDVPRVKIIAEKYSKLKKENIELRRLDEKVVCVEYDIFSYDETSNGHMLKPVQRMRAFFSVKPILHTGDNDVPKVIQLSSGIKNKFHIADDDLKKLTEKEIEIIDSKIEENRPYLDDLKRILKRKQIIDAKKNKQSLDLLSLYQMAKTERLPLDSDYSNANLLSKAELQEVKDLILSHCRSSIDGVGKMKLKCDNEIVPNAELGVISDSIVAVLLREGEQFNIFK